jgi:hypothetical protein
MAIPPAIEIDSLDAAGSHTVTFKAGMTGSILVQGFGLAEPEVTTGHTVTAANGQPSPTPGPGVNVHDVTVEPGTQLLAAQTLKPDPEAFTDLDLFLYHDADADGTFEDAELIARAATPAPGEFAAVTMPPPGAYRFSVVGFATYPPASSYDFATWTVADATPDDPADKPGLTVTGDPIEVQAAGQGSFTVEWSDAEADGRYLGIAAFYDTPTPDTPFASSVVVLDKGPSAAKALGGPPNAGLRAPPPPRAPLPLI